MTVPALPLEPNDELVAQAFLAQVVPGLTEAMVATILPADVDDTTGEPAAWLATGFVTVAVVGGNPDMYLPVNRPVMQVDVYAAKAGSNKPPWWQAHAIASAIKRACWGRTIIPHPLTISPGGIAYPGAVVRVAYLATAFRRMYDDPASYARLTGDLALDWVRINDRIDV